MCSTMGLCFLVLSSDTGKKQNCCTQPTARTEATPMPGEDHIFPVRKKEQQTKTLFSMSRFWWVTRTKTRPFCRCVSRMRLFLSSSLQLPKAGLWLETQDVFHVDYNMLCQHINFHTTLQTTVEFIGENTLPGMTKATCSISFCSVSAIGAMEISFPFSASR